ncbi:MAG: GspH/FimT family pseudopilin [Burkholderiaceae bacterium]
MKTTSDHSRTAARHQRGVSLVEACAVLTVTAVLAATAAPGMQDLIDTRRLEGAATLLATDIQFIRGESVARNQPLRLSFLPSATGSCYVIHSGAADQCHCEAVGPAQCSGNAREIRTVTLAGADRVSLQANVGSMLFDPVHGTSSPSGTLRLLGARNRAVHHVVNIMGRVRSCSPLAAMPGYRTC